MCIEASYFNVALTHDLPTEQMTAALNLMSQL